MYLRRKSIYQSQIDRIFSSNFSFEKEDITTIVGEIK
jgi:hypothetical protein